MVGFFLYKKMNIGVKMTKEEIVNALKEIKYPGFNGDIMSFGIIKDVKIEEKNINIKIDIKTSNKKVINEIETAIVEKVESLSTEFRVSVQENSEQPAATQGIPKPTINYLPEVKYKIAVASGKGGVGKSTVSVNLAVALAKLGYKVGLLDADIYGPSIPLMLGVSSRPEYDGKLLNPIDKFGVKLMSLGFLMGGDDAVIWRGPLVTRAIQQLMKDVNWGEIDIMLFDMPPGTGDAQLTLSQSISLDGAVIVTTPQDVALIDAVKGVNMFKKVNVPILGIVENMSYFLCPHCNERSDIFSSGGAKRECERIGESLLGEIPLDLEIRAGGDTGKPIVENAPDNLQAKMFVEIAKKITNMLIA